MVFPSNKTLAKIAVYGGIASISAVMWMRSKIEENLRKSEYFRMAFRTLRQNKGAIDLLGENIKEMGFNLSDGEKNYCDGKTAAFEVFVKGEKDRGKINFEAKKENSGWIMEKLSLEVKKHPDKRFVIQPIGLIKESATIKDPVVEKVQTPETKVI